MDRAATVERLAAGGEIVDIGQLSLDARRYLRGEVKANRVELFVSYSFPIPKRGYVAVGARLTEEAAALLEAQPAIRKQSRGGPAVLAP